MSVPRVSVGPWGVLVERNYALLLVGQAVSVFGDRITIIAVADLAWRLTRSSFYTALAVILATVPHAVLGFVAGPITDAIGRRRAMIACDIARAILMTLVPIALAFGPSLAPIYVLVLLATVSAAVFNPTRLVLIADIVPPARLAAGNAFIQVTDRIVEIVGSAVAGLIVLAVGALAFYIDAATFVFSALMLVLMRVAEPIRLAWPRFRSVMSEATAGMRAIRANAVLYSNLRFSLVAQMSIAILNSLTAVYLFREFGGGADAYGAAEALIATGFVVCGLVLPLYLGRVAKGRVVIAGFILFGLVLLGLSVAPTVETAFALFAVAGVANVLYIVPNITIYQEHTTTAERASVFSSRYALLNLTWLPVMVVGGAVADVVGVRPLIGLFGALTLATASIGLFLPAVRDVR